MRHGTGLLSPASMVEAPYQCHKTSCPSELRILGVLVHSDTHRPRTDGRSRCHLAYQSLFPRFATEEAGSEGTKYERKVPYVNCSRTCVLISGSCSAGICLPFVQSPTALVPKISLVLSTCRYRCMQVVKSRSRRFPCSDCATQ